MNKERVGIIIKSALVASCGWFLFRFIKDSYEELLLNPVHFFDDAYMFIRYAKIWHMGYGEAWNIGEAPVYGNTSQWHFLFVLLLTSIPGIEDDTVIKLASWIPSVMAMAWLPWFAARHSTLFATHRTAVRALLWAGILCPLLYWNTPFAYHWLTGMDTGWSLLFNLLLIDAVLCFAQQPGRARLLLVAVLIYVAYFTRPENLLAGGLFALMYLGIVQRRYRDVILLGAMLSVLLIIDAAAKYWYFGDIVPLAFYTKSSGFFEGFVGKFHNHPLLPIFFALRCLWPFFVVLVFSVRREQLLAMTAFLLPVIIVTAYFFTMLNIMNLYARYEFPFMIYVICAAVLFANTRLFNPFHKKEVILAAIAALGMQQAFAYGDKNVGNYVRYLIRDTEFEDSCDNGVLNYPLNLPSPKSYSWKDKMFQMADAFRDAPAGTTVVTTEHGYFGAKNLQVTIIDVAGLHNRYIAHHGFSAEWLYAQKPDVIWLPHWHYTCLNHKLVFNDEFRQHYKLYPGLFNLGIALRTDSPRYAVLRQLVERKVMELYPGHHLVDYEQVVR